MKKYLIILSAIGIAGCGGMTPEEIHGMRTRCENAGMTGELVINGFTFDVVKVVCRDSVKSDK